MADSDQKPSPFQAFDKLKSLDTTIIKSNQFETWDPVKKYEQEQRQQEQLDLIKKKEQELASLKDFLEVERENITEKSRDICSNLGRVNNILKEFEAMKQAHWEFNAAEIVEFATALAEKIILKKLDEDPGILVRQIKQVLHEVDTNLHVEIHMCPDDLEMLEASEEDSIKEFLEKDHIKWVGDLRLNKGDVHIDTEQYRLDASILTAIENLKNDIQSNANIENDKAASESTEQTESAQNLANSNTTAPQEEAKKEEAAPEAEKPTS